jgi:hypothetical protein
MFSWGGGGPGAACTGCFSRARAASTEVDLKMQYIAIGSGLFS